MSTNPARRNTVNEPEFFRGFRAQARVEAEHLPQQNMVYGLGIFSSVGGLSPSLRVRNGLGPIPQDLLRIFQSEANEKVQKVYRPCNGRLRGGNNDVDEKLPHPNLPLSEGEEDITTYDFSDGKIMRWSEMDDEAVALLKKYFKPENAPVLKNYYFAQSLADFNDGLVVILENNDEVEISTAVQNSGADFIFIVAKAGVNAKISETLTGNAEFFGRTVFVVAEEGSKIEMVSTQDISADSVLFQNKFSHIERGAKVTWHEYHTGGKFVKSDLEDFLAGEGAESFQNVVTLSGSEHFDLYQASHHVASHTVSNISSRGIAGSGSKILYRALLDIPKDIIGATGKEEGRFIITSPSAEIDAIPGLNVASAEGNFSHALSISHLRDTDFFFPALRGIAPYRAQAMLLAGFLLKHGASKQTEDLLNKKLSSPMFLIEGD